MKATFKVKVIDAPTPPEPAFVGTTIDIIVPAETLAFGIRSATLAEGHSTVSIDYGDGAIDTLDAVSSVVHNYAEPGRYHVRISDDIAGLALCGGSEEWKSFAPMVVGLKINALNLTQLGKSCFIGCENLTRLDLRDAHVEKLLGAAFWRCTSLTGRLDLPSVTTLEGSKQVPPFRDCTGGITEIHFAESSFASITSAACYIGDPTLGTGSALCVFDL